jgi:hypothetical protein
VAEASYVGFEVLTVVSTKMAIFWVVACLIMEAARTSETLVNFYQTTQHYNPEDSHLRFICSFREQMKDFHDWLRQRPSSLFMLLGCSLISTASLIIRSMHLDLVNRTLVSWSWIQWPRLYAVFDYGQFIWMLQTDVPVVLLDPRFNGTAGLPNADLTAFKGYAVHTWRL